MLGEDSEDSEEFRQGREGSLKPDREGRGRVDRSGLFKD